MAGEGATFEAEPQPFWIENVQYSTQPVNRSQMNQWRGRQAPVTLFKNTLLDVQLLGQGGQQLVDLNVLVVGVATALVFEGARCNTAV